MNYMLCRNRVRNFDQWKRVFDNHADAHRAAGLRLVHIWHEVDNSRHIFFLFEVEDMERARTFLDSSDATTSASGLIEGDFRFFSESMGYGPPTEAETVSVKAAERVATTNDANNPSPAETVNTSVPPELVKSPEPEKTPALSEAVKTAEPGKSSTPPEPVTRPMPAATMKGPERVKSAPPVEPVEGWEPVENWPPAEAAPETTHQPSRELPPKRGRWVRIKY